ncbi:MAG: hypothetical protein DMF67_00840 [Acidobacteria bacterium]|nr:MAG: hypothetical protein DMF67_00840 [Acidobacteriota bacterium]
MIEMLTATGITTGGVTGSTGTGEIGIMIVMIAIAPITTPAFISPQITAAMAIALTPTTGVTRTACTPARTMRAAGKAMNRSAHTFTGTGPAASSLFSATAALISRLTGTASFAAMRKGISIMKRTSAVGAFIGSDSVR